PLRAPVDPRPGVPVAHNSCEPFQVLSVFFQSFGGFLLGASLLLVHGLNGFLADLVLHEKTSLHFGGKETVPDPVPHNLHAEACVGAFLGVPDTIRHRNQGLKSETILPPPFTRTDDLLPEPPPLRFFPPPHSPPPPPISLYFSFTHS